MSTIIKLPKVRLMFQCVFKAEPYKESGPKYNVKLGILKSDVKNIKIVEDAIQAEAESKYKAKAAKTLDRIRGGKMEFCFLDGDKVDMNGADGHWILTANRKESDGPPNLRDENNHIITTDNGKLFKGCYVNAKVEIWAQDGENTGMRCGLIGIQFAGIGEKFGGASKPKDDDFDVIDTPEETDDMA